MQVIKVTACNNEGALVFSYNLEDIDQVNGADVYNGQKSVFWKNLRACFGDDIKEMYKALRSSGALSYEKVEKMFEEHQDKWPEAVFNEDAYFKYIEPLLTDGTADYLPMLQGSKAEQRKWWLYNRFRYLDSKYNAGDALASYINVRGYAKADITVTPYADIYPTIKYGSYVVQKRGQRNVPVTLENPVDQLNDTEIAIYSADQLASVGDLSGLKVGYCNISMATKLQDLKVGDGAADYSNENLKTLTLGNNILLKTIDVRNCPNLVSAVDASKCVNLREAYFDGTGITGLSLPNGGFLQKLHLPATVTNLTLRNQTELTEFVMPSYENVSTLWLEGNGSAIDTRAILNAIPENARVRLIGFAWEATDAAEITALLDRFDKMRGLDENGNNMDKAQVYGSIHTNSLTGAEIASFNSRYSDIKVTADHTSCTISYYTYDGEDLLGTETVLDGGDGGKTTIAQPTRSSTAYGSYTFAGWSTKKNQLKADANALKAVTSDRNVYAAYTFKGTTYTVTFKNGSTTLQTVTVPAGETAEYTGDTPAYSGDNPNDWVFGGWDPKPTNVLSNKTCTAQFYFTGITDTITDSWDEIIAATKDGSYKTKYKLGDTKKIDLGSEGIVNMQLVGIDNDDLADGSGKAPTSWISEQTLRTKHRMNPQLKAIYGKTQAKVFQNIIYGPYNDNEYRASFTSQYFADVSEIATLEYKFTAKIPFAFAVNDKRIWPDRGDNSQGDFKITVTVNGTIAFQQVGNNSASIYETVNVEAGETTILFTFEQCSKMDVNNPLKMGDIAFSFKKDKENLIQSDVYGDAHTLVANDCRALYIESYAEGTGAIGGWEKCELRSYLKNTIKPLIPENVRNAIKTVTKVSNSYDTNRKPVGGITTQDDLWIPSGFEISGNSSSYKDRDMWYTYFDSSEKRKKENQARTYSTWSERNVSAANSIRVVFDDGSINNNSIIAGEYNIVLGFCL